jgi:hypothetical protein
VPLTDFQRNFPRNTRLRPDRIRLGVAQADNVPAHDQFSTARTASASPAGGSGVAAELRAESIRRRLSCERPVPCESCAELVVPGPTGRRFCSKPLTSEGLPPPVRF